MSKIPQIVANHNSNTIIDYTKYALDNNVVTGITVPVIMRLLSQPIYLYTTESSIVKDL